MGGRKQLVFMYLTLGEWLRRWAVGQERVDLLDAQHGFVAQLETHHLLVVTTVAKCQQDLSKYLPVHP